jgi:putative membrane protein
MKRVSALLMMIAVPMLGFSLDSNTDESFLKNAAEGGLAEVDAGKLAEQKGVSAAVKDFGGMMIKDHSAANNKLWRVASAQNVKLPTSASVSDIAAGEKLKLMSGESFDKSYIENQIKAHQDAIELFKKEIASGKNAQAKEFASATLPTVEAHLQKITQIAGAAGVSTK